jgi:hypothetical protein
MARRRKVRILNFGPPPREQLAADDDERRRDRDDQDLHPRLLAQEGEKAHAGRRQRGQRQADEAPDLLRLRHVRVASDSEIRTAISITC